MWQAKFLPQIHGPVKDFLGSSLSEYISLQLQPVGELENIVKSFIANKSLRHDNISMKIIHQFFFFSKFITQPLVAIIHSY